MAPSLGRFQNDDIASKDKPIEVSNEEEEQLVGAGPQNPEEVRSYREKVNMVFDTFGELLTGDVKDALQKMVALLKRVMVKHWGLYGRGGCEQCGEDHQASILSPPPSVSSDRWH